MGAGLRLDNSPKGIQQQKPVAYTVNVSTMLHSLPGMTTPILMAHAGARSNIPLPISTLLHPLELFLGLQKAAMALVSTPA